MSPDFDRDVRVALYQRWTETGAAPSRADLAVWLRCEETEIAAAFERLAEQRIIVLDPHSRELWMAMPFSAFPTAFRVTARGQTYFANCAWDALGFAPMLGCDATIETVCADCGEPEIIEVANGRVRTAGGTETGVVHFATPAAEWWEDIGFT
jgi:Alkylmercury lyase